MNVPGSNPAKCLIFVTVTMISLDNTIYSKNILVVFHNVFSISKY